MERPVNEPFGPAKAARGGSRYSETTGSRKAERSATREGSTEKAAGLAENLFASRKREPHLQVPDLSCPVDGSCETSEIGRAHV